MRAASGRLTCFHLWLVGREGCLVFVIRRWRLATLAILAVHHLHADKHGDGAEQEKKGRRSCKDPDTELGQGEIRKTGNQQHTESDFQHGFHIAHHDVFLH